MLTSYADESGHSDDPACSFVGLGGLVAPSGQWDEFADEWGYILEEFIPGSHFHMKEFIVVPGIGPYEGWKEERRRQFMGKLIAAIVESDARPVGCVVSIEDFNKLKPEHQKMFRDPYYIALQEVTKGLSLAGIPKSVPVVNEQVAMIYGYQEEFGATPSGRVEQLWHLIKSEAEWGQWMGTYTSASPSDVEPLQAADLFAYELTHEFENWIKRPHLKMRWPLKQILHRAKAKAQLLIKIITFPQMLQMLIESGVLTDNIEFSFAALEERNNTSETLAMRIEE